MKSFNNLRYTVPLIIFGMLLLFLLVGLKRDPHQLPSPLLNQPIPQFDLPVLEQPGQRFTSKQFQGQVSILNVWASWCTVCRAEHPRLVDLAQHKLVAIYGLDYKDQAIDAQQMLMQYGNPFQQVGFDEQGRAAIDLGVYGTPETFVIDQKGIVRYKWIGELTTDVLQNKILPLVTQLQRQTTT